MPIAQHRLGQPPQVFQQAEAQHRRHGPKLANSEWNDRLVSLHEPGDVRLIQGAVGVRDQCQRQRMNAWIPGQRPGNQLGQLRIITLRQILADFAEGFFHDVEVVQQPIGVRAEIRLLPRQLHDPPVSQQQCLVILSKVS